MTTKTSQPPRQVMEQRVGTNIGWIAIGTLIILIVLLAVGSEVLNNLRKKAVVDATTSTSTTTSTPTTAAPSTATQPAPSPPPSEPTAENWHYLDSEDSMTGKPGRTAGVISTNTVAFNFPYAGEQHATLFLRAHPRHGKDVMLTIEKGQFLCSISGCSVFVRFDDKPPRRFSASEPADHKTTMLFIGNYNSFVAELKKAKTLRIEALFFSQGSRVFVFDVAGLKW